MEITVKLVNQDVASAREKDLMALMGCLRSLAVEAEGKQEEPAKAEEPKKRKKAAEPVKQEEEAPAKEETKAKKEEPEPVKEEKPKEEPGEEEPETAKQEEETPAKAKVIDLEEMKKRVMAIKDADSNKWDSIKELIKQYGKGKLSAIPETERESFMEAVEAL